MTLDRFFGEKVEKKSSPRPSNAAEQRPTQAPPSESRCESCSFTGTSKQVASHATVHANGSRYEIRQVLDPATGMYILEDAYNSMDRCLSRAKAREDQTSYFYQVYDRKEDKVVFG